MKHLKLIKTAVAGTAALCTGYLLLLRGRSGHPGLKALQGWSYAHRGLHGNGVPENSMLAFRKALEHGYGIELDIHLMKDGNLAVIHDTSLLRTTGADVNITDLTTEELANYPLEGTDEIIPTFEQVLELYAGKAPLIIELKADGNHKALVDAAVKAMEGYEGAWCMESFDPRCIFYLKKDHPAVIRGQLTENFFDSKSTLHPALKFVMKHNLTNFLTVPDFISYKFSHRKDTVSNFLCRKVWDIQGVTWTLKNQQEHDAAIAEGWLPIFEDYTP